MIFSRLSNDYAPETHGTILDQVAAFAAKGKIKPIATTQLDGLMPETMKKAHELVEKADNRKTRHSYRTIDIVPFRIVIYR
jgi:hypothetical protein